MKISEIKRTLAIGFLVIGSLVIVCLTSPASAQKIRLKDGRILKGKMLAITGVADSPVQAPGQGVQAKAKESRRRRHRSC